MKTKRSAESTPVAYTFDRCWDAIETLRLLRADVYMSRGTSPYTREVWSDAKGHARLALAQALANW